MYGWEGMGETGKMWRVFPLVNLSQLERGSEYSLLHQATYCECFLLLMAGRRGKGGDFFVVMCVCRLHPPGYDQTLPALLLSSLEPLRPWVLCRLFEKLRLGLIVEFYGLGG